MFNKALFERTKKLCGAHFRGAVAEGIIRKYEGMLEVTLPVSYKEFIKMYGAGGSCGQYIYGIEKEEHSSMWKYTKEYRKKRIIPKEYIVVIHVVTYEEDFLICLDSSNMVDGECPAVKCILCNEKLVEVVDYATDFWEVFNKENEKAYMKVGIPREQEEACSNKGLPDGMGYGCCWMVVEGASGKAIIEALVQGKTTKSDYRDGLEKVNKAGFEESLIAITATYKKQNYIIGPSVHRFFYETDKFLEMCKNLPYIYVYMTDHVSETHGFALVENGKIIRLFSYDEEEIKSIGEPLPEEIALSYRLPKNFDDVWNKEGNFTKVNEDILIELAIQQVGIDVEQYPYKAVTVGKMKKGIFKK